MTEPDNARENHLPCLIATLAGLVAAALGLMLIDMAAHPGGNYRAAATVEGLSAGNAIAGTTGVTLGITSLTVDTGGQEPGVRIGYEFTAAEDTYLAGDLEGAYTVCAITGDAAGKDGCTIIQPGRPSQSAYAKGTMVCEGTVVVSSDDPTPQTVRLALFDGNGTAISSHTVALPGYEEYGTTYDQGKLGCGAYLTLIGAAVAIVCLVYHARLFVIACWNRHRARNGKQRGQQHAPEAP